jgi:flagellar hook-associated protein 2
MASVSSISTQQSSVEQLVSQYIALERKPVDELETSKSGLQKKINVYTDLKAKLKTLQDLVKKFIGTGSTVKIGAKIASSSNEKIFTAEANSNASVGINTIFVSKLASRDTAISKQFQNLSGTSLASNLNGTTQEFDIIVGSNTPVRIAIDFNDENETRESILKRIVDAINNSDADVTASYIKDTTDSARITIVSNKTGSTNELTLQEVSDSSILRKLGIITASDSRPQAADTSGGFIQSDPNNLNASLTVNGIDIVRDTNTVSDVLGGVTINLLSTQTAGQNPETLTVTYDKNTIKGEIESFIEKYNDVIKYLNDKTSVDTTNFVRGDLVGEYAYGNLKFSMRTIVSGRVSSVESGGPSLLSQIGITIARDGTLKISDENKLKEYIDKGDSSISNLFSSEKGVATKIDALLNNYIRTGGIVDDDKKLLSVKIGNINKRIADFESRLKIREDTLRREFMGLQKLLSTLNSQQSMVQSSMFNYSNLNSTSYI